jgi:hypothetical protein
VVGYGTALTSPPNVGFNTIGNPASISSATPFTLLNAEFAAAWNDGLMVSITAKLGATTVGTDNFTLNTTTKTLETFSFGPVTELDFSLGEELLEYWCIENNKALLDGHLDHLRDATFKKYFGIE